MDNQYAALLLRAVARDLDTVADRLSREADPPDPVVMLALATRGRDDHTRRVACANMAVAEAIADGADPDPFEVLRNLPPWPGAGSG